jgi:hypothetical protein
LETEAQSEVVYARAASPLPFAENKAPDDQTDHRFQASQPSDAVSANTISADLFYEPSYDVVLQQMVEWIVTREGPVLDTVLARRIARAHGFQRTGSRIQERIEKVAQRLFKTTEETGGTFYWPREVEPCEEIPFRRPADDDSARGVEEICTAELLSLARWVLHRGLSEQESVVAIARELGMQRLREASRIRIENALLMGRECK